MHIVDITMFYPAQTGGVRTYLSAKSDWLARQQGIRHTVIAPTSAKPLNNEHRLISIPSIFIPGAAGIRVPLSSSFAVRQLQALRPDIIEAGDPYQLAWAALAAKEALGVPAVAYYHTDLPGIVYQRFGNAACIAARSYLRRLYRQFDLVLAPSRATLHSLELLGLQHIRHQPLGVDTRRFNPAFRDAGLRESLGLPAGARVLLYAGRFTREKRLPILIDAMEKLSAPYHLLMVGSPKPVYSRGRITCLPFQSTSSLARIMASCDALVHPGDAETFGLVVLEALASGIPVVGVNAAGVAELVDEAVGTLVEPGSSRALADGVRRLFERDLKALGAAARQRAVERHDWNRVLPRLLQHYATVLPGAPRPAGVGVLA